MKRIHIIIPTLLLAMSSGFITDFAAETSPLPASATETVIEGDCNGDGQFSADDAMLLQKWLTGSGQLAGNLINYDNTYVLQQTAYSIIEGRGTCAGMARSYILLLLEAGFTEDEIQLISAPAHALAGI